MRLAYVGYKSYLSHERIRAYAAGGFAVLRCAYARFVSELARVGYSHVDEFDFLDDYQRAWLVAFQQPATIHNSFAASGLMPVDAERVLSKPNISLRTPTPLSSSPNSRSSQFTPKIPGNRDIASKASFNAQRSIKAAIK